MLTPAVFASGSWSSTYSIESPCCRTGSLTGSTEFTISGNNRTLTVSFSNSRHAAGGVNVSVQRRNTVLGLSTWGASGLGTRLIVANGSGSFSSVNSGTYRLHMANQFNGAHSTGNSAGTATNSGSIRVSWN
ncbi:MAG: hypothetical protein FWG67_00770 [Defluviitaleaceae bacterium]|nr:hypothetical protein [Defluviitaleaceae bacterium]